MEPLWVYRFADPNHNIPPEYGWACYVDMLPVSEKSNYFINGKHNHDGFCYEIHPITPGYTEITKQEFESRFGRIQYP